jgi:hypothetical protein
VRESNQDEARNAVRRALGLAIQIIEDLPDWLQPKSDMADMRALLDGESTGRDSLILVTAIALALAFRARHAMTVKSSPEGFVNRLEDFRTLFTVVQMCDPWTFAIKFTEACDRFSRENETD